MYCATHITNSGSGSGGLLTPNAIDGGQCYLYLWPPIIRDRSTFSYLKQTKMQDFDQKIFGVLPPDSRLRTAEGGHFPHPPPTQPMLSDP